MKRIPLYGSVALLFTSFILQAWPAEIAHMFNKQLNSHIFLIGDLHAGKPNQTHCQDAEAIIDGARKLKAHLILEDLLLAFNPESRAIDQLATHEQLLLGLLLADPINFDYFTLSHHNLTKKILSAFGQGNMTIECLNQTISKNAQRILTALKIDTPVEEAITPLLGMSLLADANHINNTNIEWRHALVASLSGYQISAKQAFESINKTIKRIEAYNDCPILNDFNKEVIKEYHTSIKPFQKILEQVAQSEQPMLQALDTFPLKKILEMAQKCSTGCQSFYAGISPTGALEESTNLEILWPTFVDKNLKSVILTGAFGHVSLLDPIIAHHICKEYNSGPIIVYAGDTHIAAISKLLSKLGYETVDFYGALHLRGCILKQLDLDYYFSLFKDNARILSLNEIMNQNHYCPILPATGINTTDEHNMTMLMHAAQHNRYSTARYCMLLGACPTIHNKQGQTALDLARKHNSIAVLKLFEEFNVTK